MLSIIVIFFNMRREAKRTLFSLSPRYQNQADPASYEVIAIDNGSQHPLVASDVEQLGDNFRYIFHHTDSRSPVGAVNLGVDAARGENFALIVDGARMASPGLISDTKRALSLFENPLVGSLSWHLGPDVQNVSMLDGYNQSTEDALLDDIAWPSDGYRLFDVSVLAQSSKDGFLAGVPSELSWLAMRRRKFQELGGYDADFQSPGGGLVNQDFLRRALSVDGVTPIVLLGEGVFHQFHGGVATNVSLKNHPYHRFHDEYKRIRGEVFVPAIPRRVYYFGSMPPPARKFLKSASKKYRE